MAEIFKSIFRPIYVPIAEMYFRFTLIEKIIALSIIAVVVLLAFITLAGFLAMFHKAGQAPWKALIPIYNLAVILKIVEEKGVKLLLFFIPVVGLVYYCLVLKKLAHAFGKKAGFAVGMFFLPFIFIPIAGFDDSECLTAQIVESDDYWTVLR